MTAVACGGHVAVQVIRRLDDHPVRDVRVLVQGVGEIGPSRAVVGRRQAIPDLPRRRLPMKACRIEGVAINVRAHDCQVKTAYNALISLVFLLLYSISRS